MQTITFGDLNNTHLGKHAIIDDGKQVHIGVIETIGHYRIDNGNLTGVSLKGQRAVQRACGWAISIGDDA